VCGIAGIVDYGAGFGRERLTQIVLTMRDTMVHRGPDDAGVWVDESGMCALGHRRLSIIDLSPDGRQPMGNDNGSVQVTFNGEIYNFQALRERLQARGHRFRSRTDSEVLPHLFDSMDPARLTELDGMFSFGLWHGAQRRLLLAIDPFGKKPLYYCRGRAWFAFASELRALSCIPGFDASVDREALALYLLLQYVPAPWGIYTSVRKLVPGAYLLADFSNGDPGEPRVARYVTYEANEPSSLRQKPLDRQVEELRPIVVEAVRKRLISDVPLGAFLSGGVDSSLVAALMQQQAEQPVRTFSIGFDAPQYDESRYARRVAEHLGTRHEEFHIQPRAADVLPRLVWHYDEPFADASAIPTYFLSELTRRHVTVALSGDGGDELFAGYDRYRAVAWGARFDRLPAPLRKLAGAAFWQGLPGGVRYKSRLRRFKRFTAALARSPARRYLEWIAVFNEARRAELYTEQFIGRLGDSDPQGFLERAWRRAGPRDAVSQVALADLVTYLPCDLMTKVDIASMAHGLECRQPFLDHRVVELALEMPVRFKYRRGRGKRILRETFGDLVPPWVFRRPKMGFGVPLDRWFRHELRELAYDVLLASRTAARGYFRQPVVRRLLDEHVEGRGDHSQRIWALLVLELWMREWVD